MEAGPPWKRGLHIMKHRKSWDSKEIRWCSGRTKVQLFIIVRALLPQEFR